MQNKTVISFVVSVAVLLSSSLFNLAAAAISNPTANFTLRSSSNAGPASAMDDTWGGGFDGFITNLEGFQVDRTFLEYDVSAFGGPVSSAFLNFNMSGSAADIVSMSWYAANGVAEMADWFTALIPVTSFGAGDGSYSIDITALINANLGLSFIGFAFSIDDHPQQAFFDRAGAPQISFTGVPEPGSVALLGLGLAAVALARRRRV